MATSTASAAPIASSGSGMSAGTIAGIVIGSMFGGALLVAIGVFLYRHQSKASNQNPTEVALPMGEELELRRKEIGAQEVPSGRLQYPEEEAY